MPVRKHRVRVVIDTNVLVGHYLSRERGSPNSRVIRLWRDRRVLQLIICDEIVAEYADVLNRLGVSEERISRFAHRLQARETVSRVNLGARAQGSRDPADNVFLSTASAGTASFLVTNDKDLLDLEEPVRNKLRFRVVTPTDLLAALRRT